MRHVPAMRALHPEIQLEIVISNAMANLTRREAEIAIRPTLEPPEILVGRRVADIAHAIYGSRAYLSRREDNDLSAPHPRHARFLGQGIRVGAQALGGETNRCRG
jgi:DNA-binding transcriptional LysR family regulator